MDRYRGICGCVVVRTGRWRRNGTESLSDNGMACKEEGDILKDAGLHPSRGGAAVLKGELEWTPWEYLDGLG